MQKLRPYVLPGLFVFHLVVLCVTLSAVPRDDENSVELVTALVTIVSQFFLTALFAGLGSGSWSLRIPSWGALAALSWLSFVFFAVHSEGGPPNNNALWGVALAPIICWIVLVTLLLCLRGIPHRFSEFNTKRATGQHGPRAYCERESSCFLRRQRSRKLPAGVQRFSVNWRDEFFPR